MRVAVLGYGLIGRERASGLRRLQSIDQNIAWAVCDPFANEQTAVENMGGHWCESYKDVVAWQPHWIIIATPHNIAETLTEQSLALGSRVLLEKPLGRSRADAERLMKLRQFDDQLWIGFNYRFFPGVAQAIVDARSGRFGPLVNVTFVLGHGGAPGMEAGWKLDPTGAGGGCLIDPGIHVLDLCHQLLGEDLEPISVVSWGGFWKTGIEEEIHALLKSGDVTINVQVSVVRWRSVFRMELHGCDGYGIVTGRGRSYGPQYYRRGKRWGWQTATNQEASEEAVLTADCDSSFVDEMKGLFYPDIANNLLKPCPAIEGLRVMRTYELCRDALRRS